MQRCAVAKGTRAVQRKRKVKHSSDVTELSASKRTDSSGFSRIFTTKYVIRNFYPIIRKTCVLTSCKMATGGSSGCSSVDCASSDSSVLDTDDSTDTSLSEPAKKKRKECTGKFKTSWTLPKYIFSSSKGSRFASCKLCSSPFSVSHGGINDIKRHVDGLKHQQKLKESQASAGIANYFGEFREPSLAQAQKVLSAELMMSQSIAMHNLPFQAADHLTDIIPVMFPDSKIASAYACKHTKTKAIICDALDPYLKKPVVDLCKSVPFNLLCDESNELGDSEKLLTILLRAFEPHTSMVVTRHLDTVGITDFTANGIFLSLKQTLEKYRLSFDNLVSFTSDTCNVMKGARGGVIAKLRQEQPEVIDVYCICHVVNLCVKAAIKVIPVKVDELLVDIFFHFHHSVKRITSLKEYADFCCIEFKSILKHCETRWLSLRRAIERTLEMWEALRSYFASHPDVEKSGRVKTIFRRLNDPQTKLWLCLLSNTMPVFNKFNVFFQTTSTATVHKLHGESVRLLKTVLSFFIKPDVILRNSNDLTKLKYDDPSNHLLDEQLFVGDSTTALILHDSENEGESMTQFYKGVVKFYEAFVRKQRLTLNRRC